MDLSGLTTPFPVNRPLTDTEQRDQLKQRERLNGRPRPHLRVIKMNSTYLECVDSWFSQRGLATAISTGLLLLCAPLVALLSLVLLEGFGVLRSEEKQEGLLTGAFFGTLLLVPVVWGLVWLLRKDSFTCTHYPLRFHRTSRLVYVFRPNGTVLTVPWDDLFVTLGYDLSNGSTYGEVRAHVLAADNVTVLETFGLSHSTLKSRTDPVLRRGEAVHPESIYVQWEFLRRYMEDGPHAVLDEVQECFPVDRDRESPALSFKFVSEAWSGGNAFLRVVTFPFWSVGSVFRMIAMRTSKVPQWPSEVDAACVIDDGDPYAVEGDRSGRRITLFPNAVRPAAAGDEDSNPSAT